MKKAFLVVFICIAFSTAFSQHFMHGIGTGFFVEKIRSYDASVSGFFTYSPRINVSETETMSLSLGIPLSVGIGGSYGQGFGGETSSFSLMVNTPLIFNVNFGAGSSKQNKERIGFFVGGGFAHQYNLQTASNEYYGSSRYSSGTYGPAGNVGMRFAVGNHQKNIEAKINYMRGIGGDYEADIYGLAAIFNF